MMAENRYYDSDLQMFVDPPREFDRKRLVFLRYLADRGRLEHDPVSDPTGNLCRMVLTETLDDPIPA